MRRLSLALPLAVTGVLAMGASCDSKPQANPAPVVTTVVSPSVAPVSSPGKATSSPAPPAWPAPEDCITYNPSTLTSNYAAGIHQISDGSHVVLRLHGGPAENLGQQG